MLQEQEIHCPLGLIGSCVVNEGQCINLATCTNIGEEYEDEDECAFSDLDPHLDFVWVDPENSFWIVRLETGREMPAGYAEPVRLDLPAEREDGKLVVKCDREAYGDDDSVIGKYARASHNNRFFFEVEGSPIIMVEWDDDGEIRSIETENGEFWECALTNKSGMLLAERGQFDPLFLNFWARPDWDGSLMPEAKRFEQIPQELLMGSIKAQLENICFTDEIMWCCVCKDHTHDGNESGISDCGHIRYVSDDNCWAGTGYEEEDLTDHYKKSFRSVASELKNSDSESCRYALSDLVEALQDRAFDMIWMISDDLWVNDEWEYAMRYLDSLTKDIDQSFIDRAIAWLTDGSQDGVSHSK